jgi:hypothetical protein
MDLICAKVKPVPPRYIGCYKEQKAPSGTAANAFSAYLGPRRGVEGSYYTFQLVNSKSTSGHFTDSYVKDCAEIGMKPVCDHRNYCQNDARGIYIGQEHHMAHGGHRANSNYFPGGFTAIREKFNGACFWTSTNHDHGKQMLCQTSPNRRRALHNDHQWKHRSTSMKLACGKQILEPPSYFAHGPNKSGYTPQTCEKECKKSNYLYSALHNGGKCKCDNSYGNPKAKFPKKEDQQCGTPTSGSGPVKELAHNKPASQSTETHGGKPNRAVDGNTSGNWGHNSCTHTARQQNSWWQVELGAKYKIEKVMVWNRSDCCGNRLNQATVMVDNVSCGSLGTTHAQTVKCNGKTGRLVNDRSPTLMHSNCVLSEVMSIDISDLVLDSL